MPPFIASLPSEWNRAVGMIGWVSILIRRGWGQGGNDAELDQSKKSKRRKEKLGGTMRNDRIIPKKGELSRQEMKKRKQGKLWEMIGWVSILIKGRLTRKEWYNTDRTLLSSRIRVGLGFPESFKNCNCTFAKTANKIVDQKRIKTIPFLLRRTQYSWIE